MDRTVAAHKMLVPRRSPGLHATNQIDDTWSGLRGGAEHLEHIEGNLHAAPRVGPVDGAEMRRLKMSISGRGDIVVNCDSTYNTLVPPGCSLL